MTEDFKTKLLKWITGNYQASGGDNSPQFSEPTIITNNLYNYMEDNLVGIGIDKGFTITSIIQGKNAKNQSIGLTALCGYVMVAGSATEGYILIVDDQFNPIQLIQNYDSGTKIGPIEMMSVGDDGNFYGIEQTYGTTTRRFVMLNNVVIKLPSANSYKATLRKSYNLPANISNAYYFTSLIKAPSQSKFLISGTILVNSVMQPIATELTVEVGSSNQWKEFRYNGDIINNNANIQDTWASWDANGDLDFKLVGIYGGLSSNSSSFAQYYRNGDNMDAEFLPIDYPNENFYQDNIQAKILNKDNSYIGVSGHTFADQPADYRCTFYLLHYNLASGINFIYNKTTPYIEDSSRNDIKILIKDTDIFYSIYNVTSDLSKYDINVGRIIGDNYYEKYVANIDSSNFVLLNPFEITNAFNLYNVHVQTGNTCYRLEQIYNSSNYNGLPYQALNSLVPNSANIYDSNDVVIFARNLYNKIINNNTTISTIEVPNDFLNEGTIKLKELISQTNGIISSDPNEITKNIYEELLVNFVNSLLIKNSNNSTPVINNTASNRLNNTISNPLALDYEASKIAKYKINYANGYSQVNPLDTNLTFNGLSTNYIISIYVPLEYGITSVELLSADETTVYQTIDCSNLENNKYYTINQKMEVV